MLEKKQPKPDVVKRGNYTSNPLGIATFVGLRALDPLIQYSILSSGAGIAHSFTTTLGSSVIPQGGASTTDTVLDSLNVSDYRLGLLSFCVVSFLKQSFHMLFIGQEPLFPASSSAVAAINTAYNTANSLLFLCSATSAAKYIGESREIFGFPSAPFAIGSALFIVGIAMETLPEIQRLSFKKKPENKGKCYTGGLWAFSRHVNYFGYTMWRGSYALASAGSLWGGCIAGLVAYDFISRAIPPNEEYCAGRYKEQWAEYEQKTPYVLIPYVW